MWVTVALIGQVVLAVVALVSAVAVAKLTGRGPRERLGTFIMQWTFGAIALLAAWNIAGYTCASLLDHLTALGDDVVVLVSLGFSLLAALILTSGPLSRAIARVVSGRRSVDVREAFRNALVRGTRVLVWVWTVILMLMAVVVWFRR